MRGSTNVTRGANALLDVTNVVRNLYAPGGIPRLAGNTCSHSWTLSLICGELASMPAACGSKMARPRSSVGSGQFGTPWERIHRANLSMSVWISWSTAREGATPGPPSGSRCPQALAAAGYSGLLAAPATCDFGHTPLLLGSGKFGTP
jgi:hypothetical protein